MVDSDEGGSDLVIVVGGDGRDEGGGGFVDDDGLLRNYERKIRDGSYTMKEERERIIYCIDV